MRLKFKPYSFSKISLFYQCPFKFKLKYIDKIKPPFEINKALEKGRFIHSLIENYFNSTAKLEDEFKLSTKDEIENYKNIFESLKDKEFFKKLSKLKNKNVEMPLSLNFKKENVEAGGLNYKASLIGFIDFFGFLEKNSIVIIDWKTGKVPKEPNILQVKIYALWAFLTFNVETVHTCFYYVEHNKKKCFVFKNEDKEKIEKEILSKIKYIENEKEFRKQTSPLCDYCEMKNFNYCEFEEQNKFFF